MRIGLLVSLVLLLAACGGDDPGTGGRAGGGPGAENQPPEILTLLLLPETATARDDLHLALETLDPERDPVDVEVTWFVNGGRRHSGPELRMPQTRLSRGDAIYAEVWASDGVNEVTATSNRVVLGNLPPDMRSVELLPAKPTSEDSLMVTARGVDPEGDRVELVYRWSRNGSVLEDAVEPVLPAGRFRRGDEIEVSVAGNDGKDLGFFLSSGTVTVENGPPAIVSEPSYDLTSGRYHYQVRAEDPDGDSPLRYELLRAPNGMKVDVVGGLVTWDVPETAVGQHDVEISVSDAYGGSALQRYSIDVRWEAPPAEPDAGP